MTVDVDQLAQLRLMRDYIGAALNVAETMDDTLMAALLADIEHSLSQRIGGLVNVAESAPRSSLTPSRFTIEAGYGRSTP